MMRKPITTALVVMSCLWGGIAPTAAADGLRSAGRTPCPTCIAATSVTTTLYVDATLGSDSNDCSGSGAGACATIQAAVDKLPKTIRHPVTINVAAGTYSAGAYVSGFTFDGSDRTAPGQIIIQGTLQNATVTTGTATGTATAATTGNSGTTQGTLTDSGQTWTTDDLAGKLIEITGGTASGTTAMIESNTATTITILGSWQVTPGAGSTYAIRSHGTQVTGVLPFGQTAVGFQMATATTSYAFIFNNTPSLRTSSYIASPSAGNSYAPVVLRRVWVTSAQSRGVMLVAGQLSVDECRFSNNGNQIYLNGQGDAVAVMKTYFDGGSSAVPIYNQEGTYTRAIESYWNFVANADNYLNVSGVVVTLYSQWNHLYRTSGSREVYRLSNVINGISRFEHSSGFSNCVRYASRKDSVNGGGRMSIDAMTCSTTGPSFNGSGRASIFVDQQGVGFSTFTPASSQICSINNGVFLEWNPSTTWTVTDGLNIGLTDNGAGWSTSILTFRALPGIHVMATAAGTTVEESGGSAAATSGFYASGVYLGQQTLPTCDATYLLGTVMRDSTGGTGGKATKVCICMLDTSGAAKWFNLLKGSSVTTGTTTTCPDS